MSAAAATVAGTSNPSNPKHRSNEKPPPKKSILVLHGSRQTGDLLLGRMHKLRKRLEKFGYVLVAPSAPWPHPADEEMRQWWCYHPANQNNTYEGFLEHTLPLLQQVWTQLQQPPPQQQQQQIKNKGYDFAPPVGLLGFSQGARLAHLLTVLHERQPDTYFAGLQFTIMCAGYWAPTPTGMDDLCPPPLSPSFNHTKTHPSQQQQQQQILLQTPSLHIWGLTDRIIVPEQSEVLAACFNQGAHYVHEGGHHVPMRAADVATYVDFIQQQQQPPCTTSSTLTQNRTHADAVVVNLSSSVTNVSEASATAVPLLSVEPDEETKQIQQDEVEAMQAIFPDEFRLLSSRHDNDTDYDGMDRTIYHFPIRYQIALPATEEGTWPPKPLHLHVSYPATYPHSHGPDLSWTHDNHGLEFSSAQREACQAVMQQAMQDEQGMPCVYACYAAAKDFFESGAMDKFETIESRLIQQTDKAEAAVNGDSPNDPLGNDLDIASDNFLVKPCPVHRAQQCNQEGLEIAALILKELGTVKHILVDANINRKNAPSAGLDDAISLASTSISTSGKFKGGHWMYTIGLVGKPSAGKSTFFNAATAFARQRDDADNVLGGASMAPHPFTTIDPNIGFCFVPAPKGLCPEDDLDANEKWWRPHIGSTHGRDPTGARFLPVLLKDVAGLVPGAYQGRGRGNKFLNDLTDADVLVHVLDASGTADAQGNDLGQNDKEGSHDGCTHPLEDMEWIRKELIEWIYNNLMFKWQSVTRKGRSKLMDMFSGYGQGQGMLWTILHAVEKYMEKQQGWDRPLDRINEWDEGDVRRLVSAFLGVRFPMALALNKSDLPSSAANISDIQQALPVHGAYIGTPLCAQQEMSFIRNRLEGRVQTSAKQPTERIPTGVWNCLRAAISLHEPVLVFPVSNFIDYAPLPGLLKYATGDPSLPSAGMVACVEAAGGQAPSLWDAAAQQYVIPGSRRHNNSNTSTAANTTAMTTQQQPPHVTTNVALRDVLVMKPGSTVEDAFVALKNRRALEGEFIRAEAAGRIGVPSRPVPKHQLLDASNRILKIMTNKKTPWQHSYR